MLSNIKEPSLVCQGQNFFKASNAAFKNIRSISLGTFMLLVININQIFFSKETVRFTNRSIVPNSVAGIKVHSLESKKDESIFKQIPKPW